MPAEIVDAYGEVSPDGRDHFPVVLGKIAHAAATEPGADPACLRAVTARTLVMAGDDDLVTLDHTVALYRALPAAELAVLPNASHLLLLEHSETVRAMVLTFLTTAAAPTYMPIARAHQGTPGEGWAPGRCDAGSGPQACAQECVAPPGKHTGRLFNGGGSVTCSRRRA